MIGSDGSSCFRRMLDDGVAHEFVEIREDRPWRVMVLTASGRGALGYGIRSGVTPGWSRVGDAAEEMRPEAAEGWEPVSQVTFDDLWSSTAGPAFGDAVEAVQSYQRRCASAMLLLQGQFTQGGRDEALRPYMARDDGSKVRAGRLGALGEFELHGNGVFVFEDNGALLNFDWTLLGSAKGNAWRLSQFARSCGEEIPETEFDAILSMLFSAGLLVELGRGWFLIGS